MKLKRIQSPRFFIDLPPKDTNLYDPDLARLTKKINKIFYEEITPLLEKKKKYAKNKHVQITLAKVRGGSYLSYAIPVDKPSPEAKKYFYITPKKG